MSARICKGCNRSVDPLTRTEKDKKTKKSWMILYCPYERCNFNIEIMEAPSVKYWNEMKGFFEDDISAI